MNGPNAESEEKEERERHQETTNVSLLASNDLHKLIDTLVNAGGEIEEGELVSEESDMSGRMVIDETASSVLKDIVVNVVTSIEKRSESPEIQLVFF